MSTAQRTLTGADGLGLRLRVAGEGPPVVCVPGGPGNSSDYLENLGGLDQWLTLLLLDPRGTGGSAAREEPDSFTLAALAADLEAIRVGEGLERLTVLAHSAGGRVALEWAAAHPDRVEAVVLVTTLADSEARDDSERERIAALRAHEPWYAEAAEAGLALRGRVPPSERSRLERLTRPFWYARWDERAQAHESALGATVNLRAAVRLREELRRRPLPDLARVSAPVLVIAGELDAAVPPAAAERLAGMLPAAELVVLAGVSHFPWVDDAEAFGTVVATFLTTTRQQAPERRTACG